MATIAAPPKTRRWTRVEYERLIELGVFQPGERLELLDGLLVVREPQGARPAAAIRRVLAALRRALGDAWQIDSQLPIALDADSEPEPDVAVVPCDPGTYREAHPSHAVLIVEIAESSYRTEREPEAAPAAPYGRRYRGVETLRPPATVAPLVAPGVPIPVADLLP